jgi:signal peptidase I
MTNDSMPIPSSPGLNHLFADVCVGLLNQGQSVRFKANGWSMHPTICDGEMINVEPVLPSQVRHGDIILYRSPRGITAHRVIHIQKETDSVLSPKSPSLDPRHSSLIFYTRGDSLTAEDFPVMSDQILGKVFSVERNGRAVALYGNRAIIIQETRLFVFTLKRCVVHALNRTKGLFLRYDNFLKKSFSPGCSKMTRC